MAEITDDDFQKIFAEVNAVQHLPTMSLASIDEMEARKHDLDFQCALCIKMMKKGEFLPFAFDRAAVLLRKAKRFDAERIICEYTELWAKRCEAEHDGGAMLWLSPKVRTLLARLEKIRSSPIRGSQ